MLHEKFSVTESPQNAYTWYAAVFGGHNVDFAVSDIHRTFFAFSKLL